MRLCAALVLSLLAAGLAGAPEPTEEVQEKTAVSATHQEEDAGSGTTVDRSARRPPPLEEFVPSEEVSADRPVSFPTDI